MAGKRTSEKDIRAQIPAAIERAVRAQRAEPHAKSASYDRGRRMIHVKLTNGSVLSVPVAIIPDLRSASDEHLAAVEVGPGGVGLRWAAIDADLSVAGLARLALGAAVLLRAAGAAGGMARSAAKAEAARGQFFASDKLCDSAWVNVE